MKDPKDMTSEEIQAFIESLKRESVASSENTLEKQPARKISFKRSKKLDYEDERHIVWVLARDVSRFIKGYNYELDRNCPIMPKDYEGYVFGDQQIEEQIRDNFCYAYPDAIAACIEMCRVEAGDTKAKPTPRGAFFLSLALEWEATPKRVGATPFYSGQECSPSTKPPEFYDASFWQSSRIQAWTVWVLVQWAGKGFPAWMRKQREELVSFAESTNCRWR